LTNLQPLIPNIQTPTDVASAIRALYDERTVLQSTQTALRAHNQTIENSLREAQDRVMKLEQTIRDASDALAAKESQLLMQTNRITFLTNERDSLKAMLVCNF
jgi:chromosome segregation ATPase